MTQDLLELMRERIAVGLSEPDTVKHLEDWNRTALLMLKDGRHYHFIVQDMNITVHEGTIENPDMKIQSDEETIRKLFLEQMRAEVALLKPKLKVKGNDFKYDGYDATDLAFHLTSNKGAQALTMNVTATEDSPIVDPAFVISKWGHDSVTLEVNGKKIERGNDFRVGRQERLDGTDLIVWFRFETTEPATITLTPKQ